MKRSLKFPVILLAGILASGCGALDLKTQFANRISCDPNMKEMFVGSKYGPLYIGSDVKKEDAETACQAILIFNVLKEQTK